MIYQVILIECGRATHRWVYENPTDALAQLTRLLIAFDEVNEVCPTIVKTTSQEAVLPTYVVIHSQIVSRQKPLLDPFSEE